MNTTPSCPPLVDLVTFGPPAGSLLGLEEDQVGFHTAARSGGLLVVTPVGVGDRTVFWRLGVVGMVVAAATSCTVATGNRTAGTYYYGSVAGNAKFGEMGPEGMRDAEIDNATGAGLVRDTAKEIGKAYAWGKAFDALGNLIEEGADVIKDGNATDEAVNASNNATKEAVETFVPPEPASTIP
jgi:hypothetical protein